MGQRVGFNPRPIANTWPLGAIFWDGHRASDLRLFFVGLFFADFLRWISKNKTVVLKTFKEAVSEGEVIVNALQGAITISAIQTCKASDFENKIIIDIANPLDFSQGFPPSLLPNLQNQLYLFGQEYMVQHKVEHSISQVAKSPSTKA